MARKKKKATRPTQLFRANLESIAPGSPVVFHSWGLPQHFIFRGIKTDSRNLAEVLLEHSDKGEKDYRSKGKKGQIAHYTLEGVGAIPGHNQRYGHDTWLESEPAYKHRIAEEKKLLEEEDKRLEKGVYYKIK